MMSRSEQVHDTIVLQKTKKNELWSCGATSNAKFREKMFSTRVLAASKDRA